MYRVIRMIVLATALAGCAGTPGTETKLTLPRSVPFAATAGVSDAVRDECRLETNFAEQLRTALAGEYSAIQQVERVSPATPGRTLTARITHLQASGPTASFTVDGVLRDNGKVIGSFTARREKPGAATGASRCGPLFQISKQMSLDIARWVREPQMNAQLGTK
jgi:hypothetical protein